MDHTLASKYWRGSGSDASSSVALEKAWPREWRESGEHQMATASPILQTQIPSRRLSSLLSPHSKPCPFSLPTPLSSRTAVSPRLRRRRSGGHRPRHRPTGGVEPLESPESEDATFDLAVKLFNGGEFYRCHDVLEEMWYSAEEPMRTLLHGILQCAVGFHHLLNQVKLRIDS